MIIYLFIFNFRQKSADNIDFISALKVRQESAEKLQFAVVFLKCEMEMERRQIGNPVEMKEKRDLGLSVLENEGRNNFCLLAV